MLKSVIKWGIGNFEKKTGYDTSYMKEMADSSASLALLFNKFIKLNNYVKATPNEAMQVAKLTTLKMEDCGSCLQLNINFALWSGLSTEFVKNVLHSPEKLKPELKLVHDFAYATIKNEDLTEISVEMERIYGREIIIELAVAIATCRVYPNIKRAMGYAKSCSLMKFDYGES